MIASSSHSSSLLFLHQHYLSNIVMYTRSCEGSQRWWWYYETAEQLQRVFQRRISRLLGQTGHSRRQNERVETMGLPLRQRRLRHVDVICGPDGRRLACVSYILFSFYALCSLLTIRCKGRATRLLIVDWQWGPTTDIMAWLVGPRYQSTMTDPAVRP